MESKRQWMATNRIKTRSPLNSLFPVDPKMVDAIAEHMKVNKYDESQPIALWDLTEQEGSRHALYVVDGHTRLQAAKKAKLSPVYVARMKFQDNDAALQYAIHNQRDRRNLTDADLFRCIEAVDRRKQRGGDRKSEQVKSKTSIEVIDSASSAEETARIVGTSKAKVERARSVLDHADKDTKEAVLSGEKSIHKAYKKTQGKRKVKKIVRLDQYSSDFKALSDLQKEFLDAMIGFGINHRDKKREWKKYLTEIHGWTSNLESLTGMWLNDLEKKPKQPEVEKSWVKQFRSILNILVIGKQIRDGLELRKYLYELSKESGIPVSTLNYWTHKNEEEKAKKLTG